MRVPRIAARYSRVREFLLSFVCRFADAPMRQITCNIRICVSASSVDVYLRIRVRIGPRLGGSARLVASPFRSRGSIVIRVDGNALLVAERDDGQRSGRRHRFTAPRIIIRISSSRGPSPRALSRVCKRVDSTAFPCLCHGKRHSLRC